MDNLYNKMTGVFLSDQDLQEALKTYSVAVEALEKIGNPHYGLLEFDLRKKCEELRLYARVRNLEV